LVNKDK
jgi:hypothetical protein